MTKVSACQLQLRTHTRKLYYANHKLYVNVLRIVPWLISHKKECR